MSDAGPWQAGPASEDPSAYGGFGTAVRGIASRRRSGGSETLQFVTFDRLAVAGRPRPAPKRGTPGTDHTMADEPDGLRRRPVQGRSSQRIDLILDTTAELIDEN